MRKLDTVENRKPQTVHVKPTHIHVKSTCRYTLTHTHTYARHFYVNFSVPIKMSRSGDIYGFGRNNSLLSSREARNSFHFSLLSQIPSVFPPLYIKTSGGASLLNFSSSKVTVLGLVGLGRVADEQRPGKPPVAISTMFG